MAAFACANESLKVMDMNEFRLLAYFDMLGFKNLVLHRPLEKAVQSLSTLLESLRTVSVRYSVRTGESFEELSAKYDLNDFLEPNSDLQPPLSDIRSTFETETGLGIVLMSDSLVIYSEKICRKDNSFTAEVTKIILATRILLKRQFELVLPVRGAVTWGEFYVDRENSIYCGKALVEAIEVAESQEWIGAVVCEPLDATIVGMVGSFNAKDYTESYMSKNGSQFLRPKWDIVEYDVPFKSKPKRRWIVNWASDWNAGGPVRDDFFSDVITGEPQVDLKYDNTLQFLKTWHDGGRT